MYQLKLTYFDFDGGRGEPARLAMHIGGIAFEDFRFSPDQMGDILPTTPLHQVPTLTVDGKQLTQSNAITRFVGKLVGIYPADEIQAFMCDEILEAIEDLTCKLVATFGLEGSELQSAREALVSGPFTRFLTWAEQRLVDQGGRFFAENRLTVADLKVFVWIKALNSGNLDHVPTTLVQDVAPKLNEHNEYISNVPEIFEYYRDRALQNG